MKKLVSLLLVLIMVFTVSMAMAETVTVAPGDALSFDVEISGASGKGARIGLEATEDAPVADFKAVGGSVNDTVPPKALNDYFVVVNLDGIDLLPSGENWADDLTVKYTMKDLANGHIGTVSFNVAEDAEEGVYTVSAVKVEGTCTVTGSITFEVKKQVVSDRLPGDVNDDGFVDLIDSVLLERFLAEWDDVTINMLNADVNGDGEVDLIDSVILDRYLAEWDDVVLI